MKQNDIVLAANQMIKLHGESAEMAVAMRLDQLRKEGNEDGVRIWSAILGAVQNLRIVKRGPSEFLH